MLPSKKNYMYTFMYSRLEKKNLHEEFSVHTYK